MLHWQTSISLMVLHGQLLGHSKVIAAEREGWLDVGSPESELKVLDLGCAMEHCLPAPT